MIETVLFDLDGTLLDSIPLLLGAYRHVTAAHRGRPLPDELFLRGVGTPLLVQIADFARDEAESQSMLEGFRAYFRAHHDTQMHGFPGASEVVRALHEQGVPMAIVTSKKRRSTQAGLDFLGLSDILPVRVCADDVERPKPHPEPVIKALEVLGADPATAVFVGDSTHDLAAGRAAGVHTAAALWGPMPREDLAAHSPTWWLDEPLQVLDLLSAPRLPRE